MGSIKNLGFFLSILMSLLLSSSSQSCSNYKFSDKQFRHCIDLPYLNSFIHWNYNSSSGSLQLAYRQTEASPKTWAAWGINPTGQGMVGTQALVALAGPNGAVKVYTSPIDKHYTDLARGKLKFNVSDLAATYANSEITIFATLGLSSNLTTVNQVWQNGFIYEDIPQMHELTQANARSKKTINLLSSDTVHSRGNDTTEKTNARDTGHSKEKANGRTRRHARMANIHGVLNAVSWGVMLPIGALISRYMKVFNSEGKAWFYLHVTCQSTAYVVGMAGAAIGLKLGNESAGVQHNAHRIIGITLFVLGTLQVLASLLRPKPDHKYRLYWSIYHISTGYSVVILSIINVFGGIKILKIEKKWMEAYIGVVATLAVSAFWLEVYKWRVLLKKKKQDDAASQNGTSDVAVRIQPAVPYI